MDVGATLRQRGRSVSESEYKEGTACPRESLWECRAHEFFQLVTREIYSQDFARCDQETHRWNAPSFSSGPDIGSIAWWTQRAWKKPLELYVFLDRMPKPLTRSSMHFGVVSKHFPVVLGVRFVCPGIRKRGRDCSDQPTSRQSKSLTSETFSGMC